MKLPFKHMYTLQDLKNWVDEKAPMTILMSRWQVNRYIDLVMAESQTMSYKGSTEEYLVKRGISIEQYE